MADVFISYHEKSAGEIVKQIAAALENEGITCWYAQRDLIGPGSFAAIIARAIRDCKVFLLVMNEESTQSEHVKNEIGIAFHRISNHEKMSLALFRLDDCVLPDEIYYYLNRFQITNGNPPDEEHIQKLVEQIPRILAYPTNQLIALTQPIGEDSKGTIGIGTKKAVKIRATVRRIGASLKSAQKQLFALIFAIFMSVLIFIGIFSASWFLPYSHVSKYGTIWRLDNDGVLIIYTSISDNDFPWTKYSQYIHSAIIDGGIIYPNAFLNCDNLTSVVIRRSNTSETVIREKAFEGCSKLASASIPAATIIMDGAFPPTTQITRRPPAKST